MMRDLDEIRAEHYESLEAFQRSQVSALTDAMDQIIKACGFQPGPPYEYPLFKGIYSIPRLIEHLKKGIYP